MSVITEQVLDIIPCSCLRDSKYNGNQVAGGMWQFPFPMCKPPARSQWKKKKPAYILEKETACLIRQCMGTLISNMA